MKPASPGCQASPLKVTDLLARKDPENAREHTDQSQAAIRASIEKLGPSRSILVDADGIVRAGNGTLTAAAAVGIENVLVVPSDGTKLVAVRRSGLSEAEKTALALADNRTAELSRWGPLLGKVAQEVAGAGFDTEGIGFAPKEMEFLLRRIAQRQEETESAKVDAGSPGPKAHIDKHSPDQTGKLKSGYEVLVYCDTLAEQAELLAWCKAEGHEARHFDL